ncbi:MAG: ATP-binding protein, partial [Bacteroidota bacterium]
QYSIADIDHSHRVLLADKKRTSTDGSETDANSAAVIAQPLHSFIQDSEKWRTNINKLFQLIQERIDAQLQLNQIYKVGDEFLSIPLQSTINQLRQNQDDVLNSIRNWWSKRTAFISRLRRDVTKENTLTDAEKIARFIETYRPAADNPQYAGIFLTHGYVGDSFWVGRDRELTHAKKVIDQWRDGFRGSLLITGQRSAGKTLFGNTLVNRHFANQTIALAPNSTIRINGRRLKTDYQLGPALQFIRDNTLNDHPLVWIDDIELWTDTNISYAENIRQLRSYIDRYSGRMFFMVSTSNWQREHLATTMDLDQLFQAEINLDWMSLDEIQQAILIRHGATHKTLVNTEGEKTSSQDFARMTRRIYAATKGNIGNALNRWSAATERYSEDKVVRTTDYNYPLPDFINMDNGILLHAISMKKRTNDYRLRKLFGPSFNTRFNSILQRLIGMGIVKRSVDGQIEINEIAANEIARLLDKHDFLQCGQR